MLLNFHPIIGIAGPFTSNHGRCATMPNGTTDPYELNDRLVATHGTVFLSGTRALARLPFDQLLRRGAPRLIGSRARAA